MCRATDQPARRVRDRQLWTYTPTITPKPGYNGFPRGCSDDALPWARAAAPGGSGFLDTKYAYVCHAEMNAILNRNIAPLHGVCVRVCRAAHTCLPSCWML